ncbi:MAG: hypothetical protein E7160_02100 [Firmicutes bacterium]|nr:hypothetical protein [Bacillota bacterium]
MNNSRTVYVKILDDRIADLNKQISALDRQIQNKKFVLAHDEKKLISLKKEVEKIEQEKREYERTNRYEYRDTFPIDALDARYDSKEAKVRAIKSQIEDLNDLKEQLQSTSAKKRVDRKIERRQEKIKKLKNKETRISGIQRNVILSKRVIKNLKNKAMSKQEANVDYYTSKLNDTQTLKDRLDPNAAGLKGVKDSVLNTVYEIKEKHYMKKKAKHDAILNEMQQRSVGLVGANAIVMSRNAANRLRNGRDQLNQMLNEQANENTQTNENNLNPVTL